MYDPNVHWDPAQSRLLERSVERLRAALPDRPIEIAKRGHEDRTVRLPRPERADYSFELWFYGPGSGGSGGRAIVAVLPGSPEEEIFWSVQFEPESFVRARSVKWVEALDARADGFDDVVIRLVHMPTRIIQRRGLLTWEFVLELRAPDGSLAWQNTCYRWRFGVRAPPIRGRECVYTAPAIAAVR